MYDSYMEDLEKAERERRREKRKKDMDNFSETLKSTTWITFETTWRQVLTDILLKKTSGGDGGGGESKFSSMDHSDAFDVFQEYIKFLEKRETEQSHKDKEIRLNHERENREAFISLLNDQRDKGHLSARSRWKDFLKLFQEHPVYTALGENVSGSIPRELFTDMIEELYLQYQEDKGKIRSAMKNSNFVCMPSTLLSEFQNHLQQLGDIVGTVSEVNIKIVWGDEVDKAKERAERDERRRKKLRLEFADAIRSIKKIDTSTEFEVGLKILEDEEQELLVSLRTLGESIEELYKKHINYLQKKRSHRLAHEEDGEIVEDDDSEREYQRREKIRRERKRRRGREEKDSQSKRVKSSG